MYAVIQCLTTGLYLCWEGNSSLSLHSHTGDDCMWNSELSDNVLRHAPSGMTLQMRIHGNGTSCVQEGEDCAELVVSNHPELGEFRIVKGPDKLPSTYLAELDGKGATVIDNILQSEDIQNLKEKNADKRAQQYPNEAREEGPLFVTGWLLSEPVVVNAFINPWLLWIVHQSLGTRRVQFAHVPIVNILRPAYQSKGTNPAYNTTPNCWHSDFPYNEEENYPEVNFTTRLALQINLCIDEFASDNGPTQYLPGSHLLGYGPPAAWNEVGTRPGEGLHKDVELMLAPPGSTIVYDSRTWHRACPECNGSVRDRIAILQAASVWDLPKYFEVPGEVESLVQSTTSRLYSERQRADLEKMWISLHAQNATEASRESEL